MRSVGMAALDPLRTAIVHPSSRDNVDLLASYRGLSWTRTGRNRGALRALNIEGSADRDGVGFCPFADA